MRISECAVFHTKFFYLQKKMFVHNYDNDKSK